MQTNLDTTTIYVTHDYLEALSLGDRIAVINEGIIEQIGTPEEIFQHPKNEFVASAFGEPEINILPGIIFKDQGETYLKLFEQAGYFKLPKKIETIIEHEDLMNVRLGVRARDIKYSFTKQSKESILGSVFTFEPLGAKAILTVQIENNFLQLVTPSDIKVELEQEIFVELEMEKGIFFDSETKENLSIREAERRGLAWRS
jgi:multiple sugar transport system ATP-binding protein